MAQVSGLKLASYIYSNKIPVKVVILSGYKEFEYARQAIEYNVEHYLLKPIRMEEVQKVFGKIKNELDESKITEESFLSKQRKFEDLLIELQEQFWVSLLVGGISEEKQIVKKSKLLNVNIELDKPCAILDVKLKENAGDYFLHYENMNKRNLIHNVFVGDDISENISYYPTYLLSNVIKVIAVTRQEESKSDFYERLKLQLEEKYNSVLKLLKVEVIITVEKVFTNIMEMENCKDTFQMHMEQKSKECTQLLPKDYKLLMEKYKSLMGIINDGDFDELGRVMDEVFRQFGNLPIEHMKQFAVGVFSMVSNRFMKMGDNMWISLNQKVSYQKILDSESINVLKIICKRSLIEIINIISEKQNNISKSVIEQAIDYMKKHYGDELSLEYIADRFFLNQSYFSRLFKQYTGATFTDYLIQLRMEKAKELILIGKYRVYEISTIVGYKSEKYFFSIFKRYTGSSPAEYYRGRAIKNEK